MAVNHKTGSSRAFVYLIAGILVAGILGHRLAFAYLSGPGVVDVRSAAFLNRVVDSVNPLFPRKVDAETEITRVSAVEGVFIYHYRFVNVAVAEVNAGVLARLRSTVAKSSCANTATLNNFIRKDITLRYVYADKGGQAFASFDITRTDCGV